MNDKTDFSDRCVAEAAASSGMIIAAHEYTHPFRFIQELYKDAGAATLKTWPKKAMRYLLLPPGASAVSYRLPNEQVSDAVYRGRKHVKHGLLLRVMSAARL
jgi:hypothetical protein